MPKCLLTALLVTLILQSDAQVVKLEGVRQIKRSKMIVGLTKSSKLGEHLQDILAKHWDFNEVIATMPKTEALKRAKNEDNIVVISIGTTASRSLSHGEGAASYSTLASAKHLEIRGRGKWAIAKHFLIDELWPTEESLVFAITSVQFLCKTMDENNLESNFKFKSAYNLHSSELKSKTLYMLERWISHKLKREEIAEIYASPIEIVSDDKWQNAILFKEKGIAYVAIAAIPLGGKHVYRHYLVDAETGRTYGIIQAKFGASLMDLNLSKINKGAINKKILKKYEEATEGKW